MPIIFGGEPLYHTYYECRKKNVKDKSQYKTLMLNIEQTPIKKVFVVVMHLWYPALYILELKRRVLSLNLRFQFGALIEALAKNVEILNNLTLKVYPLTQKRSQSSAIRYLLSSLKGNRLHIGLSEDRSFHYFKLIKLVVFRN